MLFPLVFGAVFFTAGAVPLFLAIRTFRKDRAIAKWPRAPGKITSSSIASSKSTSRDRHGHDVVSTMYEPVVKYTYTVAGQELTGERVTREGGRSGTKPDISKWPSGQDVQVFYDPNDPTFSLLELRVNVGAVILAVMGSVFAFVGLLVPILVIFAGGTK